MLPKKATKVRGTDTHKAQTRETQPPKLRNNKPGARMQSQQAEPS
jgi:hypothetical protein